MSFGLDQMKHETPMWAKWMFRITMLSTTLFSGWLAVTNLIEPHVKVEVIAGLKLLDSFVFGLSKMFGVEQPAIEEQ